MGKLKRIWNTLSTFETLRSFAGWIWPQIILVVPMSLAAIGNLFIENPWIGIGLIVLAMVLSTFLASKVSLKGIQERIQTEKPQASMKDSLQQLENQQRSDVREYLDAILISVEMFLDDIDQAQKDHVNVTIALISRLVFELQIVRLEGWLTIENCVPSISFDFRNAPQRLHKLAKSSKVTEPVLITETVKEKIRHTWLVEKRKPLAKLRLRIRSTIGDPITIDPPDDDPLHLSTRRF